LTDFLGEAKYEKAKFFVQKTQQITIFQIGGRGNASPCPQMTSLKRSIGRNTNFNICVYSNEIMICLNFKFLVAYMARI